MVGALVALGLVVAGPDTYPRAGPSACALSSRIESAQARDATAAGDLRDALAARFRSMEAADRGIFNEDVSDVVAPYFPAGLGLAEASETARRAGLGALRPFKGHVGAGMTATYVAEVDLASGGLSNVFVAVYLEFATEKDALVLRRTMAFLRASDM